MTLIINAKYIGNGVTKKQAERMVELLRQDGYDVRYGRKASTYEEIAEVIDGIDWVAAWDSVIAETCLGEL